MPTRSTCTSISSRQLSSVHITAASNRTPTSCKIGSWNAFSINNKSAFIENYILSSNLDMFAIVETSHEATNSPSLIASSPSGYNFLDKARRPPPGQDATNLRGLLEYVSFTETIFEHVLKTLGITLRLNTLQPTSPSKIFIYCLL